MPGAPLTDTPTLVAVPLASVKVKVALAAPLAGDAATGVAVTLKTVAPARELYAPIAATANAERMITGAFSESRPSN